MGGTQVRSVAWNFSLLGVAGSGAQMRGSHFPFLRSLESLSGGLRAKVRQTPNVPDERAEEGRA